MDNFDIMTHPDFYELVKGVSAAAGATGVAVGVAFTFGLLLSSDLVLLVRGVLKRRRQNAEVAS